MTDKEKVEQIKNDEFLKYLMELRTSFKSELNDDLKNNRVGTPLNRYNHGCYYTVTAIADNYLYYLEKKYNIGRGVENE